MVTTVWIAIIAARCWYLSDTQENNKMVTAWYAASISFCPKNKEQNVQQRHMEEHSDPTILSIFCNISRFEPYQKQGSRYAPPHSSQDYCKKKTFFFNEIRFIREKKSDDGPDRIRRHSRTHIHDTCNWIQNLKEPPKKKPRLTHL